MSPVAATPQFQFQAQRNHSAGEKKAARHLPKKLPSQAAELSLSSEGHFKKRDFFIANIESLT
jgi:hypothetical protein